MGAGLDTSRRALPTRPRPHCHGGHATCTWGKAAPEAARAGCSVLDSGTTQTFTETHLGAIRARGAGLRQ